MTSSPYRFPTWILAAALWVAAASVAGAERTGAAEGAAAPAPDSAFTELTSELLLAALPCLRSVLAGSRYGVSDREAAAWVVDSRSAGQGLTCVAWPTPGAGGEARWSRPLPRGLVAQVHSHPTRASLGKKSTPRPSRQDCMTAKQLRVPVMTVSLVGVYECRPADGAVVQRLRDGWERQAAAELAVDAAPAGASDAVAELAAEP